MIFKCLEKTVLKKQTNNVKKKFNELILFFFSRSRIVSFFSTKVKISKKILVAFIFYFILSLENRSDGRSERVLKYIYIFF